MIIRITNYCDMVVLLCNGFLKEFPRKRKELIYGVQNRVETYIFQSLLNSPNFSISFKGSFGKRASSYLVVNNGGELISNSLINFDGKIISLTEKGLKFIKYLNKMEIIRR